MTKQHLRILQDDQHEQTLRYFSLKPLRYIQQLAHNFAIADGIAHVTLVEVHYKRGDEIEMYASDNVLATLISKNRQHRMQYADIVYAKFEVYLIDSEIPIVVEVHDGELVKEERYHPAIYQWLCHQQLAVVQHSNSSEVNQTKKNQHPFTLACVKLFTTLSASLRLSAATLSRKQEYYSPVVRTNTITKPLPR